MGLAVGTRYLATGTSRAPRGSKCSLLLLYRGAAEHNSIEGRSDGGMKGDFREVLGEGGEGWEEELQVHLPGTFTGKDCPSRESHYQTHVCSKVIHHMTLLPSTTGLLNCSS